MGSEYSENYSLDRWVRGEKDSYSHKHIDTVQWPNNKPCSGVKSVVTE